MAENRTSNDPIPSSFIVLLVDADHTDGGAPIQIIPIRAARKPLT
jgi:hypothetical protein